MSALSESIRVPESIRADLERQRENAQRSVALYEGRIREAEQESAEFRDRLERKRQRLADLNEVLDPKPEPEAPTFAEFTDTVRRAFPSYRGHSTSANPDPGGVKITEHDEGVCEERKGDGEQDGAYSPDTLLREAILAVNVRLTSKSAHELAHSILREAGPGRELLQILTLGLIAQGREKEREESGERVLWSQRLATVGSPVLEITGTRDLNVPEAIELATTLLKQYDAGPPAPLLEAELGKVARLAEVCAETAADPRDRYLISGVVEQLWGATMRVGLVPSLPRTKPKTEEPRDCYAAFIKEDPFEIRPFYAGTEAECRTVAENTQPDQSSRAAVIRMLP